jgi:Uma2 family endonuclease
MIANPPTAAHRMSVEDFDTWIELPENQAEIYEFINGELVTVPSNALASLIAGIIFGELYIYLKQSQLGFLTGEAGGYQVYGERYAPDVAFVSKAKQTLPAARGYNPVPPDLAVEVDYPGTDESARQLTIKLGNYLASGTVVWIVRPELLRVEIYEPGKAVRVLGKDDTISGGDLLPGFELPVKAIFPEEMTTTDQSATPNA